MMRPAAAPTGSLVWADDPCPLCGRDDNRTVLEAPDATPEAGDSRWFAVVVCNLCGTRYTNPRPDPSSISHYYPTDYKPHRRPAQMRHAAKPSRWASLVGRGCPERRGILPWAGTGRLLDFGCGAGGYLKRMADQGWQVTGLDSAVATAAQVERDYGLTVLTGTLPHPQLQPGSFDVVTMWQSLEHVHDPRTVLTAAFDLLVPGGKLVVATPNADGFAARLFGPDWFALDLPRHLTHFTPATLGALLLSCGFRVDRLRTIRHADWLRGSARRSPFVWAWPLRLKPIARLTAGVFHLFGGSDCMVAVATRPE